MTASPLARPVCILAKYLKGTFAFKSVNSLPWQLVIYYTYYWFVSVAEIARPFCLPMRSCCCHYARQLPRRLAVNKANIKPSF